MPWHLSKSDPRKVYDNWHEPVCICGTAEQAKLIAAAVNTYGNEPRKESADQISQSAGAPEQSAPEPPTQSYKDDNCCGKYLAKAIRSGAAAGMELWVCPKCGCEWIPRYVDAVRHWVPKLLLEVIRCT